MLIGYPENGPLTAVAGRAGAPITALAPDAYGRHIHPRTVVPLRGVLRHGDSGGPVVNNQGDLIGVVSSTFRDAQLVSLCIDISEIKSLLTAAQTKKVPPQDDKVFHNLSVERM